MKVLIDLLKEEVENCKQKALTICDEIDAKKANRNGNWNEKLEEQIFELRRLRDKEYSKLRDLRQSLCSLLSANRITASTFYPEDDSKWSKMR